MRSILLKLTCITNMHVGSDSVTYSLVDSEVEKDPVTHYPIINASGVKGAFRQAMYAQKEICVDEIFGTANDKDTSAIESGKLKFLPAHMLFRPMRTTTGNEPYYLVTTEGILNDFREMASYFEKIDLNNIEEKGKLSKEESVKVEGVSVDVYKLVDECLLKKFIESYVVMKEADFRSIDLPIMARNCLEEERRNLWYEEVVPHHSVFYSFVLSDGTNKGDEHLAKFEEYIKQHSKIQFGGNATIGYGLTKVEVIDGGVA